MPVPPKKKHPPQAKYAGLPGYKRMEAAIGLVGKGESQSMAARLTGVSRSHLNKRLGELRKVAEEQQARSDLARAERAVGAQPAAPVPAPEQPVIRIGNETKRVPPFQEFAEKYFGHIVCPDCDRHHALPPFHIEMMEALTDPAIKRLLINVAPYHAKSTVATVYSTIYELCRDPNSRTIIVSKTQRLAEKFVYQIGKFLTDPAVYDGAAGNLIEDWGPFQGPGGGWTNSQFYVTGRQSAEKDPSVSAFGVGGHIYGVRGDKAILDDIADLENQRNVERVKEMQLWVTQELASRVGRSGRIADVGTRVSSGDIHHHLGELPGWKTIRYPCILDEENQTTLWPDHFAYADAVRMRDSMTPEQWQLVYQNVDTPGVGASFPPDIVEAAHDTERILGHYDPRWGLVAGLDPAGANAQAGYTALILLGVDYQSGRRFLVDMVNAKQLKAPQLRDQIFAWAETYPIREFRVEVNGLQSQLVQYNEEIIARLTNRGIRVVPHVTTKHNKWDPQFGVESMAPLFHNHMISLPALDIGSRTRLKALEEQLISFPMGRASDLVMAMWFAELGIRELFQRQTLPLFDPRKRVPKRIARQRRVVDFAEQRIRVPNDGDLDRFGKQMWPGSEPEKIKLVNVEGYITVGGGR